MCCKKGKMFDLKRNAWLGGLLATLVAMMFRPCKQVELRCIQEWPYCLQSPNSNDQKPASKQLTSTTTQQSNSITGEVVQTKACELVFNKKKSLRKSENLCKKIILDEQSRWIIRRKKEELVQTKQGHYSKLKEVFLAAMPACHTYSSSRTFLLNDWELSPLHQWI